MEIQTTTQFKRTLKQYKKKHYSVKLVNQATDALESHDQPTLHRLKDHKLFAGKRAVHVGGHASDWLIRYEVVDGKIVLLELCDHDEL